MKAWEAGQGCEPTAVGARYGPETYRRPPTYNEGIDSPCEQCVRRPAVMLHLTVQRVISCVLPALALDMLCLSRIEEL